MKNNKKGFTLIELLVVIAIIGLLSTLAVIALNNARAKARDAKRVSDVKQIQSALELYYNDANNYPTEDGTSITNDGGTTAEAWGSGSITYDTTDYMKVIPENPTPTAETVTEYSYVETGGDDYSLTFELESGAGGLGSGIHTASPSGITFDTTP